MWAVGRELIILIVEDEAVSRESRMLEEVTRDSEDKRPGEEDRESGRRAHNFYLPNGSKVLVGRVHQFFEMEIVNPRMLP